MRSKSVLGFDIYILISTISLMIIGVLFIYSSGVTATRVVYSNEYLRQIIWASTGLVILVFVSLFDYRRLERWALYIYLGILVLLVLTLLFGRVVNGAKSWLGPAGIGIQPSEFTKIATIIMLAFYFERSGNSVRKINGVLFALIITGIPVLLILAQPDLGTAMVFFPIFLFMAFVAGAKLKHLFFLIGSGGLLMFFTILPSWEVYIINKELTFFSIFVERSLMVYPLLGLSIIIVLSGIGYALSKKAYLYWILYTGLMVLFAMVAAFGARRVLQDYQIMRLIVFLDPEIDPQGAGWNIIQSRTAIGSGGAWGKGFLQGTQSHYRYLPQQSTDFIFSIMAEEWGFIGALVVFALFGVILLRSIYILVKLKDRFGVLIGTGVIGMISFHLIVNIGMAMGIMPITGIPLFFLSYGGSSLWTSLIGLGLIMSIYQHRYRY